MKHRNLNWLMGAVIFSCMLVPGATAQIPDPVQPGVVVEKVARHSEAEKAGLHSGDVLLSWIQGESKGAIESPFDMSWTETEQAALGVVKLQGLRGAEKQVWSMGPDAWGLTTRPNFTSLPLQLYSEGEKLGKTGEPAEIMKATERWHVMAHRYSSSQAPWLQTWLFFHAAEGLREAKQWKGADSAYAKAELLVENQQNSKAVGYDRRIIQIPPEVRAKILIQVLNAWGNAFLDRQDFVNSARYYQRAVTECQSLHIGDLNQALNLNNVGRTDISRGDLDGAKQSFSQALALLQEAAPGSLPMARSLNGLGNVAWNQGNTDQAENYHRRALEIRQAVAPGSSLVAGSLNNLGLVAEDRGDLETAGQYLRQALDIHQSLEPNSLSVVFMLNNLANLEFDRSDYAKAEEYLHRALPIVEEILPNGVDAALTLENLGDAARYRGDLATAERYLHKALLLWEKLVPESINLASNLRSLGELLRDKGDVSGAAVYLGEALAIFQKRAPESLRVVETLDGLASVLIDQDPKTAEERARHALAIREKLVPGSPGVTISLTILGDLARRKGDSTEAEADYRQAIAIQEKLVPGTLLHAESLAKLANLMAQQQQLETAAQLYEKALTAMESQTAHLGGSEETRSGFHASHANIYRDYVDLLLAQKQTGRALEVLERSRTRVLLEMLLTAHIDVHAGADSSLLEQERFLQTLLAVKSNLRLRLLQEKNDEKRAAAITKEIEDLNKRSQEVEERLRLNSPGYSALTQPQPLAAGEIQQLLDPDTVLLEYALGKQRSYLWAVSQTSIKTYQLPARSEIEQKARQLYQLLSADSNSSSPARSQARSDRAAQLNRESLALSRMILAPAAEAIQGKRLLIVSEGALQYVPFGVLLDPSTASTESSKQDPLLVKHEIVNLPSASVLAVLRQQEQNRPRPPKTVAVLADPVFETDDQRVTNQPQRPGHRANLRDAGAVSERLTRSVADVRGTAGTGIYLPRLPFSRREAHAILEATPPGQGMGALDFAANRKQAMSPELAQYRFVHIATHGLLDSEHPEFSGLVLSLVDRRGKWQDGFLSLEDVYNLNLPVDLVVLSGCKTGLGKEINGEGLIGLTRGFMYAGATRVIASTWAVDDVATAELMASLYKAMEKEKLTPAAALRQAQLEMRQNNRWHDPYYWAGFQIQGEWK